IMLFVQQIANYLDKTEKGIVAISPVDVYFEELLLAVQPDILYLSNENMQVLHDDGYFYGAPDLIVEVLSTDKNRDTIQKKSLYERAGVKEYFIVNPANRNVLAF
ncbi:MAG: Uma2 family endonuclease, partial [Bacteroidota bacterium]|nr:Uma2 family endonuclease [Bacteroidota bacterium]